MPTRSVQSNLDLYLQDIQATPLLTEREETRLARRVRELNCAESRDRMIRANLRLVVAIAKRYAHTGMPMADLIEEGNLGLMRAVESFDPDQGARLSTYASWWIKQTIRRSIVRQGQPMRVPPYMAELVSRAKRATAELDTRLGRPATLPELARALQVPLRKLKAVEQAVLATSQAGSSSGEDAASGWDTDRLPDDHTPAPEIGAALRDELVAMHGVLDRIDPRESEILRLRFGLSGERPLTLKEIGARIGLTRERVRQLETRGLATLHKLLERGPHLPHSRAA